jgi:hypothetical protein
MCCCEPVQGIYVMQGDVRTFGRKQRKWLRVSNVWLLGFMRYLKAILDDELDRTR